MRSEHCLCYRLARRIPEHKEPGEQATIALLEMMKPGLPEADAQHDYGARHRPSEPGGAAEFREDTNVSDEKANEAPP